MRLSSATVGFMGGLSAETVGALLPSPPLCRWVVVVLRPRGSKWLSVDHSACSWLCLLVDWSGYHSWLCLLVDRSGFRRGGFRRIDISAWWDSVLGCWIFGLLWACFVVVVDLYYFIV